ncbi:MAG TPA: ferritin-like domain-containing protein [Thermoanaerobaculia bacterium]|nr:ferritin-like domain-containing protein [Thermoanaerobaculia bacterium]
MNIYKVMPDLSNERQLRLWHKALRSQWSAEDMRWDLPVRLRSRRLKEGLGRLLTPVLMGEQSALYSVSAQIPTLGHRSQVEAQFYLTTWAVDEARHTELFARYFRRIEEEPLSIRRFPAGYLFQSQITAKDTSEWLSGVLVSEVLATLVMKELRRVDVDPVLSDIAHGILEDEARHLGFNHLYLEDRFAEVFAADRAEGTAHSDRLHARIRNVLDHVPPMLEPLEADLVEIGMDWRAIYAELCEEVVERLDRSVDRGQKVAEGAREKPRGASAVVSVG